MAASDRVSSTLSISQWTENILNAGHLSRQEHFQMVTAALSDIAVTEAERHQINRILDDLQMGRLQLID